MSLSDIRETGRILCILCFKEIGQRALEQGLLPEASAEQIRAILSELQDTDNDVLMLARLKK